MAEIGMDKVIEGYQRFQREAYPARRELFDKLKDKQAPQVLFITCSDSRIDPALVTQTGPGDLFVCRNIGNIVPLDGESAGGVNAVLEYAILALKVRHIVVCGHSDCGAMKALKDLDAPALQAMPSVRRWLRNAEPAVSLAKRTNPADLTQALIRENVKLQLQHLRQHPAVATWLTNDTNGIHGWVYDIGAGQVEAVDEAGAWHSLA